MTLEVTISETVTVGDLLGSIREVLRRFVTWLAAEDESADEPEQPETDDNKAPPALGVNVTDQPNAGESLGPN